MDEILTLVNAGFTAAEIKAMMKPEEPKLEEPKPEEPKPEEPKPEEPKPEEVPGMAEIMNQLKTLTEAIQAVNRRQGGEPAESESVEDIINYMFSKKKKE